MAEFDASQLDWHSQYKLLIGTVTPRPIALVTSLGERGPNAAPFSFFNAVGSDPAMLMFSVGDREGAVKDTIANIKHCPEFVVHIVSYEIRDKMNVCGVDFPPETNEIVEAGFTAVPSRRVRPPRLLEAPVALECKLFKIVELGQKPYSLVIGEIVHFYYRDGIVNERFHVDASKIDPIGRMAGRGGYVRATDCFEMPRLKYPTSSWPVSDGYSTSRRGLVESAGYQGQTRMSAQQSLTAYVSEFCVNTRFEDIPDIVIRLGKKSILDALGVALSGSVSPPVKVIHDYIGQFEGPAGASGTATVIGSALRQSPRFAALANGIAIHADDFDDTWQAQSGRYQGVHPTAPVLAAIIAVAESMNLAPRRMLAAYLIGIEVCCRVFDATHINHVLHGLHVTGTCGTMGAAAAVAANGRDEATARAILGIAGSMSAGLQANVGTMVKSFHAGHAAECAVVAHDLAIRGFTASQVVLESPSGFFRALGGGCEEEGIRGKLGAPWSFVDRGIWLKPFPTGSLGHPGMTKMLELVLQHDIKPGDVAKIRVKTSENNYRTLQHHHPNTGLQAKFSFEFFLAVLLLQRKCGLLEFVDDFVNRRDVRDIMERVEYTTFSEAEATANGYGIVTTFLDIELHRGKTISARADAGKGNIANPMSEEEVAAKFLDCAGYAKWSKGKAEQAIELILRLEKLRGISELMALFRAA